MTSLTLTQVASVFPIGTSVLYFPIAGDAHLDYQQAEVTSEPWQLGHGEIVVKITGRTGGVSVDHLVKVMTEYSPHPIPDGRLDINGTTHLADAKGRQVPIGVIKPQHLLEDETVRKIIGYALALSDQVARFKAHVFEDLAAFEDILAQEYETTRGGVKGNKTFMSYDGLYKVQVATAEHVEFGPELQEAKKLFDQCLNEWSEDADDKLRAIVTRAFNTDKAGKINTAEIYSLLRLDIDDPRWKRAMDAIRAAMRVVGSKTYVRCYHRPAQDAAWQAITIDLAKA